MEEVKLLELSTLAQGGQVPAANIELARTSLANVTRLLRERREVLCPVKKFQFNRSEAPESILSSEATPVRNTSTVAPSSAVADAPLLDSNGKILVYSESSTVLEGTADASVHLKDATDAVFIFHDDIGALQINNLRNCLVVCHSGATLVVNCSNLVCHLAPRQLRLFQCTSMCFYLNICSKPIIEQSSRIWVAPSTDSATSMWSTVDDFSWLHRMASPNWKILPVALRRKPSPENTLTELNECRNLWNSH